MSHGIKLLLMLALFAGPAAWWQWLAVESGNDNPAPEAGRVPNSAAAAWKFSPEAGQLYRHKFSRKIEVKGLSNQFPVIVYAGEFFLQVVDIDEKEFRALIWEKIEGQAPNKVVLKMVAARDGRQLSLFASGNESAAEEEHVSVLKDLVAQWAFATKTDTAGDFESKVEILSSRNEFLKIRKEKKKYLPPAIAQILRSHHQVVWNLKLGLPEDLKGEEETRLGQGEISSRAEYRIKFQEKSPLAAPGAEWLARLSRKLDLAISTAAIDPKDNPLYAHIDWAEILAKLRDPSRLKPAEQLKLFGELVKFLELNPEKIAELVEMLEKENALVKGAGSPLFQQVVGALATDGSAAAEAALVAIYQNPTMNDSGKGAILVALTTAQGGLEPSTREFLADTMSSEPNKDLANGAAFALGSALENAPNDSQAQSSIQKILAAWTRASSSGEKITLLDVMGNSGREEFFPAIISVIGSGNSVELRAKAFFALRLMNSDSARSRLVAGLADSEAGVRSSAASGIRIAAWSEVFRAPISQCATSEPDAQIRGVCREVRSRNSQMAQSH